MRYCLTSWRLWQQRDEIAVALGGGQMLSPLARFAGSPDAYAGWGRKNSGVKAQSLAARTNKKFVLLEDGFLRSYAPGPTENSASYVTDSTGIYYDATRPSDLEDFIRQGVLDDELLQRADVAIRELVERRLSKYNNSPLVGLQQLGIINGRPYILLLDQVRGDASIGGANANAQTFVTMLSDALHDWPDHQIVVKAHPAASQTGYLEEAAKSRREVIVIKERCNLWPMLENADHVYTVSSQAGFEALFCSKPVSCYGMPFYAGWGLTTDKQSSERRGINRSLNEVFAAAYVMYSRYVDLHQGHESNLENTIDTLDGIRTSRAKNRSVVATCGMSKWKRYAAEPFLIGPGGKPKHFSNIEDAKAELAARGGGDLVIWGADSTVPAMPGNSRLIRMEDGFLRSVGLGAALHLPLSLIREAGEHLYFDARGPGTIEQMILSGQIDQKLLERAGKLRETLITRRMTKYLVEEAKESFPDAAGRLKILVTGQVSNDASIRYGAMNTKTNTELLAAVRERFPDAFIAYREHPDVLKGLRSGKADISLADCAANHSDLTAWIDWCERLETITSLSGFEALVRGKQVGVHGWPFYAGWGLTDDIADKTPRGKTDIDTLLAAAYILYPDYIHPDSKLPCSVERLIDALERQKVTGQRRSLGGSAKNYLMLKFGQLVNLTKPQR